jgi:hypothetical protein
MLALTSFLALFPVGLAYALDRGWVFLPAAVFWYPFAIPMIPKSFSFFFKAFDKFHYWLIPEDKKKDCSNCEHCKVRDEWPYLDYCNLNGCNLRKMISDCSDYSEK